MFLLSIPCLARLHMYRMSLVLPHPVSPMITTGIPHLFVCVCENVCCKRARVCVCVHACVHVYACVHVCVRGVYVC